MSYEYYLVCEKHQEAVYVTNNKIEPVEDKEQLSRFLCHHGTCEPVLLCSETMDDSKVHGYEKHLTERIAKEDAELKEHYGWI